MSLSTKIAALAHQHAQIVTELESLEHAQSALESATSHVNEQRKLLESAQERHKAAEREMGKAHGEYQHVKESVFRKIAYRATGQGDKWDAKATKEEREYVAAREKSQTEERAVDAMKEKVQSAEKNLEAAQATCARRAGFQRDLVQLYAQLFDGPTPEAPQDDQLEWKLRQADDQNNRLQAALALETQTLDALLEASKILDQCEFKMKKCEDASVYDVQGGRTAADLMEHNALTAAQMLAQQFAAQFAQTMKLNPAVQDVPEVKLPKTNMSDVLFDNIYTELQQHDKIQAGLQSLRRTIKAVQTEISGAQERVNCATADARPSADAASRARAELLAFRRETFDSLGVAPPQYAPDNAHDDSSSLPNTP